MQKRFLIGITSAPALMLAAGLTASAHHGWGAQQGTQSEISGTLTGAVSLAGPHATMQITDADGQVWDVTLAPSGRTAAAGLTEDAIDVGSSVTVLGNRSSNADRYEIKTVRVTHDGTHYDVYPNRIRD